MLPPGQVGRIDKKKESGGKIDKKGNNDPESFGVIDKGYLRIVDLFV